MRYFDSSALAKKYVVEAGSRDVRELLRSTRVATSRITEVEIASALARREREGSISPIVHRHALTTLHQDSEAWSVIELTPQLAAEARQLVRDHVLRAGDAIQLASCLYLQRGLGKSVEMVTLDERLLKAARAEGVTVRDGF